ncbi:MAG: acetoin utilization protein AcuC [Pseudomonadota bacterium]
MTQTPSRPLFIGSEIYRGSTYGTNHPLAIPRVSTVIDLARALGWLPPEIYVDSPIASTDQLNRFHDRAYIEAVKDAEADQDLDIERRRRYNLGSVENPIFPEIFSRPATASGGSILAAGRLLNGPGIFHSPAGGTHHGRPNRASGFCYFNDPVLALLTLLDGGLAPIFYLDLDAHHGDGVEDAMAGRRGVTTLSIHEANRWPRTGPTGHGPGGNTFNVAVPSDLNDSEHRAIIDQIALPMLEKHRPVAVVVQAGADSVSDDPLSRLSLSNQALLYAVDQVRMRCDRILVLGGGGYNPWTVARAWTAIWATLNDVAIPKSLPPAAESVLRSLTWNRRAGRNPPEHWMTALLDEPNEGAIRPEVAALLSQDFFQ